MPNIKLWRSQQLQRLKKDSDQLFDRLCSDYGLPSVCSPLLEPELIMKDTPEEVVIEARLPGVSPENLEIVVIDMFLTIKCVHAEECSMASHSTTFESNFRLPCKVRTEDIQAEFEGDLLRISMPKCKRSEARRIPIKIKESS